MRPKGSLLAVTDLPVPIRLLHPDATLPAYAHPGDAGADLCSIEAVRLEPGQRQLVPTGIAVEIPEGYVGLVNPGRAWPTGRG